MTSTIEIVPAIAARDFVALERQLTRVEGLTRWVQLDVSDGLFTPDYTWGEWQDLEQVEGKAKLELHLMIEQPELYLKEWMRVADRIIVHPESTSHLDQIIKEFEHSPVKLGVALLLQTELEKFAAELERVSLIQLMGIEKIGHQGELFAEQTLERVRLLREQYPSVTISVDGGVTLENAPRLIAAGANQLVIGSAIWQAADPIAAIKEFQNLCSLQQTKIS